MLNLTSHYVPTSVTRENRRSEVFNDVALAASPRYWTGCVMYRIEAGSEEDLGTGLGTGLFSHSERAGWCLEECSHTLHLNIEWCSGRADCKYNVCLRGSPPKRGEPRLKPVCRFTPGSMRGSVEKWRR